MSIPAHSSKKSVAVVSLLALALLVALAAGSPAHAHRYLAEYLAPFAVPAAINASGAIAGWNPVFSTAFVYDDSWGYVELPCVKGYLCNGVDINDGGVVAGVAWTTGISGRSLAVIWAPGGSGYELQVLPPIHPRYKTNAEAVAIDNNDRVLVVAQADAIRMQARPNFVWTAARGYRVLPVPGEVVDLNDAGQVAGNASRPYVYDLVSGTLTWTEIPAGFAEATVHTISSEGILGGGLLDESGLQSGAITDGEGLWAAVGGGSAEDHVFGINRDGDFVGHIRGLDPASHCGVEFVEDGEVQTLESLMFLRARTWELFEVAGMTDDHLLAAETVNKVSGLPALVRLSLSQTPDLCRDDCLWVKSLTLSVGQILAGPDLYVAEVEVDGVGHLPPTKVEVTWVMGDGVVVRRASSAIDRSGKAKFTITGDFPFADVYVTRLFAEGHRFDATRGVLHAATSGGLK